MKKKTTYKIRVGYDWTLNLVATDGNLVQSTLPNLTFVLYIAWATWDQTGSSLLPEITIWINNKANNCMNLPQLTYSEHTKVHKTERTNDPHSLHPETCHLILKLD